MEMGRATLQEDARGYEKVEGAPAGTRGLPAMSGKTPEHAGRRGEVPQLTEARDRPPCPPGYSRVVQPIEEANTVQRVVLLHRVVDFVDRDDDLVHVQWHPILVAVAAHDLGRRECLGCRGRGNA